MTDITLLLAQAREGKAEAWEQVVALVYEDLKRMARGVLGGQGSATLSPTQLVHDCYLRLVKAGAAGVNDRAHFLALAARAMRQLMLNHARDRVALKRGAGVMPLDVDEHAESIAAEARDVIELDQAIARLEIEDMSLAPVVECRLFAGMTDQETAEVPGLSLRSAQRLWSLARQRLAELLDDE